MVIERVDSLKHPIVQTLRDLQNEKGRGEHRAFYVEGTMITSRALDYGSVQFVVCSDRFSSSPESTGIVSSAARDQVRVYQITEGLMAKVVPAKPAPPVVAVVERLLHEPQSLLQKGSELLFLIDQCENPDNLGMIFRSLDAAGVESVVLTADSVDPFNRLAVRASRGSILSLKLALTSEPEQWIHQAKADGFRVVSSSAHGASDYWGVQMTGPRILVIGNEHTGVRRSISELADESVRIPMSGKMESLNIAVAGALLAYEAARQKGSSIA